MIASISAFLMTRAIVSFPAVRISTANNVVAAKILMAGRLLSVPKSPTPADENASVPICRNPSRAEALPAFLPKGANASAVAFGDKMSRYKRYAKKRIVVATNPYNPAHVPIRKKTLTTQWHRSAA